jgi:hypothetical protein
LVLKNRNFTDFIITQQPRLQIKENDLNGTYITHGCGKVHTLLSEKPERSRPLGIRRCIWKDNIKMDIEDIRYGDVDGV